MDISDPIRALLRHRLSPRAGDPFQYAARLLAFPGEIVSTVPSLAPQSRPAHDFLAICLLLRALPRVNRGPREELAGLLAARLQTYFTGSQNLLVSRSAPPVDQLWFYWLLVLARARLKQATIDMQLRVLWKNAWSRQLESGGLHAVAEGTSLDAATYNDLIALHLAYNAILFTRDFDLFPPVQKLADFLVQTAQPDHTTSEPWALAAFASLDATGTFAAQQLHDVTVQLAAIETHTVILGLLADALIAQEEAADA